MSKICHTHELLGCRCLLREQQLKDLYSLRYQFLKDQKIETIDFIKIDIQGAELDVFRGAVNNLKSVLMIISEVEFIHHYVNQPLFGDVCSFLDNNNLMFHKFLGLANWLEKKANKSVCRRKCHKVKTLDEKMSHIKIIR